MFTPPSASVDYRCDNRTKKKGTDAKMFFQKVITYRRPNYGNATSALSSSSINPHVHEQV
jgi:hypothetical protein